MAEATALLLIDVIDSFFEEGMPNHYAEAKLALDPLRRLLAAARASGALVVHGVERHRPGLDDFEWRKLPRHHFEGAADAAVVAGFEPRGHAEDRRCPSAATAPSSPPTSHCCCASRAWRA